MRTSIVLLAPADPFLEVGAAPKLWVMATETTRPTPAAAEPGIQPRTIPALWQRATARGAANPAYLVERNGAWEPVSWQEAATAVEELANGLLALGIRKGDAVAFLAQTSLEWVLLDFALAHVGGVTAPIYANSSPKDCAYVLEHSESVAVFAEDEEQLAKLDGAKAALPRLQHVLSFADLDELRARGRAYAAEHPSALAEAVAAIDPDDLYTFIYTSGTTGPPKGCMIRHRNYYDMTATVDDLGDFVVPDDLMLLYLPLAHNFGRLMHLAGPYVGFTVALLGDPLRVADALTAVRPTVLPSVPRVFEKVHTAVLGQFEAATGVKRRLVDWSLGVGRRVSELQQQGRSIPPALAVQQRLADRLVFSKVKARLGGRLRAALSGGAPLAQEIAEFFHGLGLLILEGYGLTECTTAATVNRAQQFRFGTVGPALPGFELRVAEDGEILIRSRTIFAGYYKDDEATRAVLDDEGWLHSGDVGSIDADGFLRITDRKKDILITAGGKNVAPQNLENGLKTSRFVSQALVIGDKRPYVAALVTLDEPELRKWADAEGIEGDLATLARDERVRALVQEAVDRVNADLSRFEQIKRFAILPRDFSAEHGEITPTLKLKRRACHEHFAEEIEALYAG
jgi:long-chain acyl-CoA synthetase